MRSRSSRSRSRMPGRTRGAPTAPSRIASCFLSRRARRRAARRRWPGSAGRAEVEVDQSTSKPSADGVEHPSALAPPPGRCRRPGSRRSCGSRRGLGRAPRRRWPRRRAPGSRRRGTRGARLHDVGRDRRGRSPGARRRLHLRRRRRPARRCRRSPRTRGSSRVAPRRRPHARSRPSRRRSGRRRSPIPRSSRRLCAAGRWLAAAGASAAHDHRFEHEERRLAAPSISSATIAAGPGR